MSKNNSEKQRSGYEKLLQGNRDWVKNELGKDPEYFTKLAAGQDPEVLWIGCSDSRVPANEVTNTRPGQVFVHRNIANVCVHSDMNMLSVLQYAVEVLGVGFVLVATGVNRIRNQRYRPADVLLKTFGQKMIALA